MSRSFLDLITDATAQAMAQAAADSGLSDEIAQFRGEVRTGFGQLANDVKEVGDRIKPLPSYEQVMQAASRGTNQVITPLVNALGDLRREVRDEMAATANTIGELRKRVEANEAGLSAQTTTDTTAAPAPSASTTPPEAQPPAPPPAPKPAPIEEPAAATAPLLLGSPGSPGAWEPEPSDLDLGRPLDPLDHEWSKQRLIDHLADAETAMAKKIPVAAEPDEPIPVAAPAPEATPVVEEPLVEAPTDSIETGKLEGIDKASAPFGLTPGESTFTIAPTAIDPDSSPKEVVVPFRPEGGESDWEMETVSGGRRMLEVVHDEPPSEAAAPPRATTERAHKVRFSKLDRGAAYRNASSPVARPKEPPPAPTVSPTTPRRDPFVAPNPVTHPATAEPVETAAPAAPAGRDEPAATPAPAQPMETPPTGADTPKQGFGARLVRGIRDGLSGKK